MTYQRGTDLKHCPKCQHLMHLVHGDALGDRREYSERWSCLIDDANEWHTCPREQAEKPAEFCLTCDSWESRNTDGYCYRLNIVCNADFFCGEWKERANG